jgi:hypothetical protein
MRFDCCRPDRVLARYRAALAGSIAGTLAPEQIIAAVFGERSSK